MAVAAVFVLSFDSIAVLSGYDDRHYAPAVLNETTTSVALRPQGEWAIRCGTPSVEDVLVIHEDIAVEYPDTPSGVRDQGDVEFALNYIEEGHFGAAPESIHEKAYHLLWLLVANHPFVDANKRTALNTVTVFYFLNGYRFAYDDEIRTILKQFGTDERTVNEPAVVEYLHTHTEELDLAGEIERWREDLLQYGIAQLTGDSGDQKD